MASNMGAVQSPGPTAATEQAQALNTTIAATNPNQSTTSNNSSPTAGQAPTSNPLQPADANVTTDGNDGAEGNDEDADSVISTLDSDYDSDRYSVDRSEKAYERSMRFYESDRDGVLHWKHHESSYTDKELRHRGEYSMAAMYDTSTAIELRQYVRERGLHDPYPQGVTLKYFYLRILDQADESRSFRFLALPLEIRNMVYNELLTLIPCPCGHCPALRCHAGIMRASKQIYTESKEILYGENTIDCKLEVFTDDEAITHRFTRLHEDINVGDDIELSTFYHGMSAIPDFFRRIQSLRIDVHAHGFGAASKARGFLQGCILNIASFLLDGHCLKKLEVCFTNHLEILGGSLVETVLFPLRRLSGLKQVRFTGDVDDGLARSISSFMQRPRKAVFNTVPHLYHLRCEAKAYMDLMHAIDPWKEDNYDHPMDLDERQTLADRISNLIEETEYMTEESSQEEREDTGEFRNAEAEKNLILKMKDLRKCLDAASATKIEPQLKAFYAAKVGRVKYFASTKWSGRRGGEDYREGYVEPDWEGRVDWDEL
ncbi:hypothetical protein Q7P37_006557 [Cladosporium fusiforme]